MQANHVSQVSICTVVAAVIIALVFYTIFKENTPPSRGASECNSCANGVASARQAVVENSGSTATAPSPAGVEHTKQQMMDSLKGALDIGARNQLESHAPAMDTHAIKASERGRNTSMIYAALQLCNMGKSEKTRPNLGWMVFNAPEMGDFQEPKPC